VTRPSPSALRSRGGPGSVVVLVVLALVAAVLLTRGGDGRSDPPSTSSATATKDYAPASAAPRDAIPGGGLSAHEAAGGHTLARHVGLSPEDLADRAREEGKREVSTFPDAAAAERAVAEVLYRRREDVRRWVGGRPTQNEDFEARLSEAAGQVHRRGASRAVPGRTVRVVLAPTDRFPEGFRVLTAYVTLP
jgi:filamentous hemagglutinin